MTDGIQIVLGTTSDLDVLERLLDECGLPVEGFRECLPNVLIARAGDQTVGCAALERFKSNVLLRSVAVDQAFRGRGIGELLIEEAFVLARSKGATAAYLLTTTAAEYFPRFGFAPIDRSEVPDAVKGSVEFASACPASATVMHARITGHIW